MAINQETFNTKLYDLLKTRGYDPVSKDSQNKRTTPKKADVFNFTFKKDGKEYGDAWVTIDDASNVIVYYDKEQYDSPEGKTPGLDYDDSWTGFLKHLKHWAMTKQLSFELAPKDKLGDDMAQRDEIKQEALNEGYYPINKTASYSDAVPSIKIVLQHTRQIQEGEQRFRNIARIFLENEQGERILAPTTRPGIARVYARHLAEGGLPHDDRWNHIGSLVEEYTKMAGFVRATRGNQFNESAQKLVEAGMNHYLDLRGTLGKLTGHRGYNSYFESYTPPLMEDDTDNSTINELFVQETLDPRIESVMPILNKLQKQLGEMTEVKALEEWATSIIETEDETTKTLAVPATEMLDELSTGTIAQTKAAAMKRIDAFDREIDRLKNTPRQQGDDISAKIAKYQQAKDHYTSLLNKASIHKGKMADKAKDQAMTAMMPARMRNLDEAPGAETLAHNQSTEKSNLKAFGLAEDTELSPMEIKKILQQLTINLEKAEQPEEKQQIQKYIDTLKTLYGKSLLSLDMDDSDDEDTKAKEIAKKAKATARKQSEKDPMSSLLDLFREDDSDDAHKKIQTPAVFRKGDKVTLQDLEKAKERNISGKEGLTALKDKLEKTGEMEEGLAGAALGGIAGAALTKSPQGAMTGAQLGSTIQDKLSDEEEVEESGLQAYLGNKKYGKEGMAALRKAGREHASKEKMASIRAKYDKLDEEGVSEDLDANQKRVGQVGPTEKTKQIKGGIGKPNQPHPFQGRLVGASESIESKNNSINEGIIMKEGQDDLDFIKNVVKNKLNEDESQVKFLGFNSATYPLQKAIADKAFRMGNLRSMKMDANGKPYAIIHDPDSAGEYKAYWNDAAGAWTIDFD